MPIKAVLFDLDGTLLPMDQDVFLKTYFGALTRRLAPHGYDPSAVIGAIQKGTLGMIRNSGDKTNEEIFWDVFTRELGEGIRAQSGEFDRFYAEEFPTLSHSCGFTPHAREVVDVVHQKGLLCVLATNPFFPHEATEARIRWAGLTPEDFALYTTYENSRSCKPNLAYYREVLDTIGLLPSECLMVGNDADEDMIAETLGMQTFLLCDCLINRHQKDISAWRHGGFDALLSLLHAL